jgi:hypothetical protein
MIKKQKGAGGKLSRSEIVQTRLGPKLKFGSELIAKKEGCTLSSLIETSLKKFSESYQFKVHKSVKSSQEMMLSDLLELVWSPAEGVRFVKTAFILPNLLTPEEDDLFFFLSHVDYFWTFYEVTFKDTKGNVLRNEWRRYNWIDGLIEDNLNEYWHAIKDNDVPLKLKIPKKMGKRIKAPTGVETEVVVFDKPASFSFPVDGLLPTDRETIWRDNIRDLIKHEFEKIDTPKGKKINKNIIYPTPEEQREMVERIYQEHMKWQSNSKK